jgi:hypothetical protein
MSGHRHQPADVRHLSVARVLTIQASSGFSFAYVVFMIRAASRDFDRVERHDPAVAVEDMSEFLPPASTSDVDPMVAVGTLHEFFIEEVPAPPEPNQTAVEVLDAVAGDPGCQSEIQRAALEFERFAEKFHVFARQCQQRGAF